MSGADAPDLPSDIHIIDPDPVAMRYEEGGVRCFIMGETFEASG